MNVRLFGMAAAMMAAMGVVACGDDTGGGTGGAGTGGDATASTGTGDTTPASTGTQGAGGDPTGGGGDPTGGGGDPTGGGGDPTGGGGAGGEAPVIAPCEEECAGDPGCEETPANPGDDCGACIQAQASATAECAVNATFGAECGDDPDCAAYRDCFLDNLTSEKGQAQCAVDNPEGAATAQALVFKSCGNCGDGTI